MKGVHQKNFLRISSLNIGRGIFKKEAFLVNTITEQNCDIFSVSEVDIEDFDEQKPFSIEGYNTYFPLQRIGSNTKRLLCFAKVGLEVKQRNDLMSSLLSTVWLEIKGNNQKVLVCVMYREFNDLTKMGPLSIDEQVDRLKIFHLQVEQASKEGLILVIGDMNIDIENWENSRYYLKKVAEEYQSLLGECGLKLIKFGITWSRFHKNGNFLRSSIDHALTNKPKYVNDYSKIAIDYSDHSMISVDLNIKVPKLQNNTITSRDLRKIRSNPQLF